LLAPLADGDTDAKLRVISQLGQLANPRAAQVLEALSSASLHTTPEGRVLIAHDGKPAIDAVTGEELDVPADASTVMINNRLRRAITGALAISQLFSDDAQVRLSAAKRMQQSTDTSA